MKKLVVSITVLVAFALPIIIRDPYYQHILNTSFLFATGVYAFNIITGMTGQLNAAHAGLIGIGAYTSAIAVMKLSLSFWIALPLAGLVTGFCGFIIGVPSLRVRGVYFSLTTLGVGEILYHVFDNWMDLTGGSMGIGGVPVPSPIVFPGGLRFAFDTKIGFYYLCLCILFLAIYVNHQLLDCRTGRAMVAVRENEDLALSVGISIRKTKIFSFVLASILCGITGSLFAHYFRVVSPNSFTLAETFRLCTMLIVGGMGTVLGPLVGSMLFTALPEFLRIVKDYQWVTYGFLLMLCVVYLPEGIVGFVNGKLVERRMRRLSLGEEAGDHA